MTPHRVIGRALILLGGMRKPTLTGVMLVAFLLAIFMPVPAAYELWLVGHVKQWREAPVRLDAVERAAPAFGKGPASWRYTFTDPEQGRSYQTRDIEPGDIPFTVMGWSSTDATARDYQARLAR